MAKIGLILSAVGTAALIGVSAHAEERTISFDVDGSSVVGTLEVPAGEPAPVVLLLHGFTGSRDELPIEGTEEGVFARTARLLAEAGYASLRIDFRGSGESEMAWADTTFSGQIADAVAAVDWLGNEAAVDGSRVAVLGWSQGGLVASHVGRQRPDIDTLVLWAPVVHPLHTFEALLGAETLASALAAEPETEITATLPWGAETVLKAKFYQEMAATSPIAAVASYAGPVKVIVGSNDTIVSPQPASGEVLLTYHEGVEDLSVFETDHVWDAFVGPQVLDEKMIPATLAWLEVHL